MPGHQTVGAPPMIAAIRPHVTPRKERERLAEYVRAMRAVFPMYDTPFHFVALEDTNIRSLADMAGKRIGVGPETGTAGTYVPRFLSALNIDATLSHGRSRRAP